MSTTPLEDIAAKSERTDGELVLEAAAPAWDDPPSELDEHLLDELLVEEISIDGMCGVY